MVAILLNLINEGFLIPLISSGEIVISNDSFHCNCVVIKATVTSRFVSAKMRAGRNLFPVRSVKGDGIKQYLLLASIFFFYITDIVQFLFFIKKMKGVGILH